MVMFNINIYYELPKQNSNFNWKIYNTKNIQVTISKFSPLEN